MILAIAFFGVVLLVVIVAVVLITQPPEKLARWLTGRDKQP